jgi:hypothetical protein
LFWLIPLGIENETRIDLRVVTNPMEQQETITRDSVTVKVNAVLWFRVNDPNKAVLTVENFGAAAQQVALTSLRNVIGQHDRKSWPMPPNGWWETLQHLNYDVCQWLPRSEPTLCTSPEVYRNFSRERAGPKRHIVPRSSHATPASIRPTTDGVRNSVPD